MAALGSHLRGGIAGRSRCSIFATSRLSSASPAITDGAAVAAAHEVVVVVEPQAPHAAGACRDSFRSTGPASASRRARSSAVRAGRRAHPISQRPRRCGAESATRGRARADHEAKSHSHDLTCRPALSCNSDPAPLGSRNLARWRPVSSISSRPAPSPPSKQQVGRQGGSGERPRRSDAAASAAGRRRTATTADAAGRRVARQRGAAPLPELRASGHHVARAARRARRPEAGAAPHPLRDVRTTCTSTRTRSTGSARRSSATCWASSTRTATPSIYDAMVRMAQDFSLRVPAGRRARQLRLARRRRRRPPTATPSARLAPLAIELLDELEQETVDFRPNYDGTHRGADRPAGRGSRTCSSTARTGHRGRHGDQHPAAQPGRGRATRASR